MKGRGGRLDVVGGRGLATPSYPIGKRARCIDAAPPVGVGVLDDPVRRVVPLSRCVADAAPYGGIVPRSAYPRGGSFRDPHTPVGVGVLDDPVRRVALLARCVGDAAPYGGIVP